MNQANTMPVIAGQAKTEEEHQYLTFLLSGEAPSPARQLSPGGGAYQLDWYCTMSWTRSIPGLRPGY